MFRSRCFWPWCRNAFIDIFLHTMNTNVIEMYNVLLFVIFLDSHFHRVFIILFSEIRSIIFCRHRERKNKVSRTLALKEYFIQPDLTIFKAIARFIQSKSTAQANYVFLERSRANDSYEIFQTVWRYLCFNRISFRNSHIRHSYAKIIN